LNFLDRLEVEIETGEDDFQVILFLLLQAKFITGFPAPVKPLFADRIRPLVSRWRAFRGKSEIWGSVFIKMC
jgi:hypothetical protein